MVNQVRAERQIVMRYFIFSIFEWPTCLAAWMLPTAKTIQKCAYPFIFESNKVQIQNLKFWSFFCVSVAFSLLFQSYKLSLTFNFCEPIRSDKCSNGSTMPKIW